MIEKHNPNKTKGAWIKKKLLNELSEGGDPNKTKGGWIKKKLLRAE